MISSLIKELRIKELIKELEIFPACFFSNHFNLSYIS